MGKKQEEIINYLVKFFFTPLVISVVIFTFFAVIVLCFKALTNTL